jgi:hypothetical protein
MYTSYLRRAAVALSSLSALVFLLWALPQVLNPIPPTEEERARDSHWVDTSPYWIDRQACRFLGLCGIHHVRWDAPALPDDATNDDREDVIKWDDLKWIDLKRWSASEHTRKRDVKGPWVSVKKPDDGKTRLVGDIPEYVLKYAPLVHLYSGEHFYPSDIAEFITHMIPYTNGSAMNLTEPITLDNLYDLDNEPNRVFLTAEVDVETRPKWLHDYKNKPNPWQDEEDGNEEHDGDHELVVEDPDKQNPPMDTTIWWEVDKDSSAREVTDPSRRSIRRREKGRFNTEAQQHMVPPVPMYKPDAEGYSKAPAVLVMVDKGSGILDAFWFYFYAFNLGQTVLRMRFGNHVGDWEYSMVRFENGVPRAMFLSEHEGGKAYLWDALEKRKTRYDAPGETVADEELVERPVIYSAVGSHAMYADSGKHPYVIPFGLLADETDRGPLWDPARNTYAYFYDPEANDEGNITSSLIPAASNPEAPTDWFHFSGAWGDETYDLCDKRQWRLFGQYHYVSGPQGPKFKKLDREKVCSSDNCKIVKSIAAGKKSTWY